MLSYLHTIIFIIL